MSTKRRSIAILATVALAPAAFAQVNNQWVTFVKDTNRIRNPDGSPATQVVNDAEEKDYVAVDVNHDGWKDLIVVRKLPGTSYGKRANQLAVDGRVLAESDANRPQSAHHRVVIPKGGQQGRFGVRELAAAEQPRGEP